MPPRSARRAAAAHSDDWMRENGFLPPLPLPDAEDATDPYKGATIADLKLPEAVTIGPNVRAAMPWRAGAGGGAQVGAGLPRDAP